MVMEALTGKITNAVFLALSRLYQRIIDIIPNIIAAFVILFVGTRIARLAVRYSAPFIASTVRRPTLIDWSLRGIRYVIIATSLMIALSTVGLDLTPLFTAVIASSVIIGIIIAPVVSSYLGGFFLLIDRPFEVNDRVEIKNLGISGYVKEVGFRVTRILTTDGNLVVIPNTEIAKMDLINYSAGSLRTRRDLAVSISYESDIEVARDVMIKAAKGVKGVVKEGSMTMAPGADLDLRPRALIKGFGADGIDFILRVWYEDPYHLTAMDSEIYKRVYSGFKENGIVIPYPHREVLLRNKPEGEELPVDRKPGDLGQ